jgi:serine/threonine-protein kinase HipA
MAQGISMKSKKAAEIINEINATVQNWRTFADELNVDPELRNQIQHTLLDLSK